MTFIGRKFELSQLEEFYNRDVAGLAVCCGRRRIGKSTLIEYSASNRQFVEFYGLPPRKGVNNQTQLDHFAKQLCAAFNIANMTFNNWFEALNTLASLTQNSDVIIFLDEISWMAKFDKDFPGILKGIWDTKLKKNPRLRLILCGSVSSWIQENILKNKGFVGRVSLTLDLEELPLEDANLFWRDNKLISPYEKFKLLSITGGVPRYLEEINPAQSAEENIKRLCFTKGGVLTEEFDRIFEDIFEKHAHNYKDIIKTILHQSLETDDICKQLGIEQSGSFNKKLKTLVECGFVKRDYVWEKGKKKRKMSKYRLSDNYLRFYLLYIEPRKTFIEQGLYKDIHLENLDTWYQIMGYQFENLVLSNLNKIIQILKIPPESILSASPYHQNKTSRLKACQIDLLIQTKFTYYVIEIKFRKKIPSSITEEVLEKIHRLKVSNTVSVRPVLIYQGELSSQLKTSDFFSQIVCFEDFL